MIHPNRNQLGADGTVRKDHYGAGRQPWDDFIEANIGRRTSPPPASSKYMRRTKDPEHSLESARWYWARLREREEWAGVLADLTTRLTDDEINLLEGKRL